MNISEILLGQRFQALQCNKVCLLEPSTTCRGKQESAQAKQSKTLHQATLQSSCKEPDTQADNRFTRSGNIYVFASGKDSDFLRVRFFLDDPDRSGESLRTELLAPFDFASGTVSTANVFDTTTLTNGEHTITATFARTDGTYRTITSIFTVGN